ncbi:MAG: hypothetical protein QM503_06205 [Bacteroidota bacterium]
MKNFLLKSFIFITIFFTFTVNSVDLKLTYENGTKTLTIPLKDGATVDVITSGVDEGNVSAETVETGLELCERLFDATLCSGSGGGGSAPRINSFTASSPSVIAGGTITLTYDLSNDATSCTKSGSWSGSLSGSAVTNGSHTTAPITITTPSTFTLNCNNSNGPSNTEQAIVNIATSSNCTSAPQPPAGITLDTTIIAVGGGDPGISYNGMFSNLWSDGLVQNWPADNANRMKLTIDQDKYMAAQFTTSSSNLTGDLLTIPVTTFEGPTAFGLTWVISECPGDFVTHLNQSACTSFGALKWSTEGTDGSLRCQLSKNTTYYLNLIHSRDTDSTFDSKCFNSFCGFLGDSTTF